MLILFGVARLLFLIIDILAHIHEDIHVVVFHEEDVGNTPLPALNTHQPANGDSLWRGGILDEEVDFSRTAGLQFDLDIVGADVAFVAVIGPGVKRSLLTEVKESAAFTRAIDLHHFLSHAPPLLTAEKLIHAGFVFAIILP